MDNVVLICSQIAAVSNDRDSDCLADDVRAHSFVAAESISIPESSKNSRLSIRDEKRRRV